MFFYVSVGFFLATLPRMKFLPSVFGIVESCTLTFIDTGEACGSFDVVLESFVTSWMSHSCAIGEILEGWSLQVKFATVPSFYI